MHYKDEGYMEDKNNMPNDNDNYLDLVYNEHEFDFEYNNLEDSNCERS